MLKHIGKGLDLIRQARRAELGEYDWFDIESGRIQVGKSRCRIEGEAITIFSIMIYPEYEHNGFASAVIDFFKSQYPVVYADRVRFAAREFWFKQGFLEESEALFVWHRNGGDTLKTR